ncbi:MAG: HAMP domain-containing histidine kinase [Oscillospiraceae bacterium]|nr:HAMP domain-containing histidine kinase [Oscillospiraceae bacterium]
MKFKAFLTCMAVIFLAEISAVIWFFGTADNGLQDSVEVNTAVQSVTSDWENIAAHKNVTGLDYTVLDRDGNVLFKTKQGLSESVNEAVINRDTILDIETTEGVSGKIIIHSESSQRLSETKKETAAVIVLAAVVQLVMCTAYSVYIDRAVIKPFKKLEDFAESVAGGNLDIPLKMDRGNIFGAFTESFDIMRSELKKARIAEAKANASKKELVAKLSHDIRTPVASIKAASEVGAAISENEKSRQNYTRIIHKADQINTLVTNLFAATLEELQQLTVEPADMKSSELSDMLADADYFHYAEIPAVPECLIYADKLRLQQVFDNIFANSYKYANTKINVEILLKDGRLSVKIEDFGGGVPSEEVPILKEKFKRGKNSENIEGAGLGLYISDCFMKEMGGELVIENGRNGLAAEILIKLSGTI